MTIAPGDRNSQGQFAPGNTVSRLGWAGLVEKRFKGDEKAAKGWLIRLGKFAYGKQAGQFTRAMRDRAEVLFRHPGTPEEFHQALRAPIPDDVDFYSMPADLAQAVADVEAGQTTGVHYEGDDSLTDTPGYSEGTQPYMW